MTKRADVGLKKLLSNAQSFFFMMRGDGFDKLRLFEVTDDSIIVEMPTNAPMRRSMVGLIPTTDGSGVFEVDARVEASPAPGQPENTIRLMIDPSRVRRMDRRGYPRVSFTPPIEAAIAASDGGMEASGRILNMSASGLRVETESELPPDKFLTFRFDVEIEDEIHELAPEGRIVYEIPTEGGRAYGVKFGRGRDDDTLPMDSAHADETERTVDYINLVNRLLVRR